MSFKTRLLVFGAAGALTAAMAVPAMALENEFHGMFGLRATNSNYLNGGGTGYLNIVGDSKTTNNFVEQRARLFYSAKANDDLKLVTGFELDSTWGKDSYTVDRANGGGALGADTINLETKWVYLDFNVPSTKINVKAGLQGLNDAYKNLFVGGGADAAGVLVSSPVGPVNVSVGWFRLDDHSATSPLSSNTSGNAGNVAFTDGKKTRDLLLLDGKFAVTKDVKVGASYYFVNNDNSQLTAAQNATSSTGFPSALVGAPSDYTAHVLGVNGAATFGPATVDGFFLYEFGNIDRFQGVRAGAHLNSFAGNLAGKMKVGPGTAKVNALYVNGGSNAFININNETSGAFSENQVGGAFGNMFLLVRNSYLTTNDQFIAYDSSNRGAGILGGSVGYDANITDKLFANANAGFLAMAKSVANRDKYQGTEINAEVGYKLYDNLTASVRGAYVLLGDFYKDLGPGGSDPADPYLAQITLSYVF